MTRPAPDATGPWEAAADSLDYVTVVVAGQLFGLPISRVHDVFVTGEVTRVPLARPEIAGLVNLRGRVITAVDLRVRFGLPPLVRPPAGAGTVSRMGRMAVGIEAHGEHYGLLVDEVGEVLRLGAQGRDDNPTHLAGRWAELSAGVHRLAGGLLVILDVDRVLSFAPPAAAA